MAQENPRFQTYCPYCQISSKASALPSHGLREPPAYAPPKTPKGSFENEQPPAYSISEQRTPPTEKGREQCEDTLHFLDLSQDTIPSLALRYKVPQIALRRKNNLFADHLLAARKTILVPGEFYKGGVSLSPKPLEDEEEELRKSKIRRWMVTTKNPDYDMALLYLQQAEYKLDAAVESYVADERWEREHPLESSSRGKSARRRQFGIGISLTAEACDTACEALNALSNKRSGAQAISAPADSSKISGVEALLRKVAETTTHVDILLANAGATWGEKFDTHPDSAFAKVMDLNVKSVFNTIRLFAPLLQKIATAESPSRVIVTASTAGIQVGSLGDSATFGYSASKGIPSQHLFRFTSAALPYLLTTL
ncbi:uncharacterized protein KY384_006519 [Bacidia gigantensis]|uniref:uncharacterized protein n=1 Tax=Bacidia gigantensis TaxID=2732470 RepID=UPI001D03C3BA|nr:uncharacterized protein KY384_006519 [Bacidia gigantensis]KAG8528830.1 hypothetical protein KY384_006519 [Bacidia gigantensis]